jgi:microcystin-dependent protein
MDAYIGEIRMFGGNFAPAGWEFCQGQLLSIAENDALFALIGTTYGGDGQTTFALPDLRGRIPIHAGQGPGLTNRVIGQVLGVESVTLTASQIAHTHLLRVSNASGTTTDPTNAFLAKQAASLNVYGDAPAVALNSQTIGTAGGSQPHENRQPFLAINFIISLYGVFPSQN